MLERQFIHWTVVSLTASKFKHLVSGFPFSYAAKMFIILILYDFCLLPDQFCYIIVYTQKVESCVQISDLYAPEMKKQDEKRDR
jgi:hypothetical protein